MYNNIACVVCWWKNSVRNQKLRTETLNLESKDLYQYVRNEKITSAIGARPL
jgi:hypothetical protein